MLHLPAVADNAAMEAKPPKADPPKRKRRWFQFSLRSLLALILVAGIGARWMAINAERQRIAVEAILKDGGKVKYDFQRDFSSSDHWKMISNAEPPGPVWLRKLLGDDFFTNVVETEVSTDAGLEHVDGLSQLRILYLRPVSGGRPQVTDAGLEHIRGLRHLTWLTLTDSRITDAGLVHLAGLSQLQGLSIGYTNVTDAGLKHLEALSQLRRLDLSGTEITDAGLEHLNGLNQLFDLGLDLTAVTDSGLERIHQFKSEVFVFEQRNSVHRRRRGEAPAGLAELSGHALIRERSWAIPRLIISLPPPRPPASGHGK